MGQIPVLPHNSQQTGSPIAGSTTVPRDSQHVGIESNVIGRELLRVTKGFSTPDTRRSVLRLSVVATCFLFCWTLMFLSLKISYLLTLALVFPTAGFIVSLFMIQHDCGHGSYFRSERVRDTVGFLIGVLTLTPYQYWRQTHAHHHSHSGDLDFRGFGDIRTKTVDEYLALSAWGRLQYRIYRHPVSLLTFGPAFHFFVKHRYPWDIPRTREWRSAWRGVWLTNAAIVGVLVLMHFTIGLWSFILVQLPVTLLASSIGVYLFYIQHQYDEAYWQHNIDWNYFDAALAGSSFFELPWPLSTLTAWIGIHHIHHLNPKVPCYKLVECMVADPRFSQVKRFTLKDTWRLLWLTLWDGSRLISFREFAQRQDQQPAS